MNPTFWKEARDGQGQVSNGCMCHSVLQYDAKINLVFMSRQFTAYFSSKSLTYSDNLSNNIHTARSRGLHDILPQEPLGH